MKVKVTSLIYLGIIIILSSLLYDLLFIGIPYQDPTPEMLEHRATQYQLRNLLFWIGLTVSVIGTVGVILRKVKQRKK